MEKTTVNISDLEKRKQTERTLLDSWHPHIENAMHKVHQKFKSDTKFILTESDLKCWLFYELQNQKPYIPYAVHSEVTHYAEHTSMDKDTQEETIEKKHKFRDLSLLCPWEIKANEDFLKQNNNEKKLLSKGFQHKAPAIHFELKFVRENGNNSKVEGLKSDIKKIETYNPNYEGHTRDFIIVCGTRSLGTTIENLKTAVECKINEITNVSMKERLRFYLFDSKEIVHFSWNGKQWIQIN